MALNLRGQFGVQSAGVIGGQAGQGVVSSCGILPA